MSKFWVVALETYKKHVKTVSFLVMVLAPFLMIAVSLGAGYFSSKATEVGKIAVISEAVQVRDQFITQSKKDFTVDKKITTEKSAQKALEEEKIDGYLVIKEKNQQLSCEFIGTDTMSSEDSQKMHGYLNNIQLAKSSQMLGLSPQEVQRLMTPAQLKNRQVDFKNHKMTDKTENRMIMTMVGFFIVMAMYMIVMLYSSITAQEVASEKGTRIMEVILSSTSAANHFYGKIVGISLVILTQVSVYLVTGLGAYYFMQDSKLMKDITDSISVGAIAKGLLGYNLLFLLFGVLIYTILSAFMGSLVSRSEDAPKAAAPVTYLILAAALPVLMMGISDPQNILIKIFSYIPFFSSFSMPIRIANDDVTQPELFFSIGLLVLAIAILLKFSAKVYKSTVLIYSDKSMMNVFKDALKFSK
ncbi:ABC transporter permease [Vagococcus vulneris]|uniref:ABC-2 type transporter transmembrane domain-containing protein n=1 Tax=Vagococcus vulneris TaxID=1977869 RepID=A0A429ZWW4_9ENTE|nr:ABC transporter permease [Vagococcus vulneris]RST98127.1 hypothetical protein CBF37_08825 [Vagococcus vulneris]